ncbi:DUF4179 domain-containing protein [Paenibacillus alvei]|uniref:DUF4179 domain-containing protein n=1 Tax=Paenibacillus alvei TaxID=44250 RepID=UPI0002899A0F|nr:DUF4179 domain-containing protein [Paenibacillus alvei]EJW19294.1 hypothetical protein PAV_1c02660 [Paenibacillus alvei DSM 29]MCY9543207.1 DUF4179 domain-containing protein [Paenibacillus alvei]MCY9704834.1 DUF4179 domain-containing protein [Paenibacillus alvei]MCY9735887.1 DUF4179 domain-containing protein [Paenibacillus alvei]MCY9756748.1 DUF4179 domain-containing protein [Paenibacillus alvei]
MKHVDMEHVLKQAAANKPREVPGVVRQQYDATYAKLRELAAKKDAVPDVVKQSVEQSVQALRSNAASRKKRRMRQVAIITAAVSFIGMGIIGSGFVSPVMAQTLKKIPLLNTVFTIAGDLGLQAADEKGLVEDVNQSMTLNGETLKVSKVIYDGTRLSVGFVQPAPGRKIEQVKLVIDGELDHFANSLRDRILSEDGKTVNSVINFRPNWNLPDEFELKLFVFLEGMEQERFEFSFPVKKVPSRTITSDMVRKYGETTMKVDKIVMSEASTQVILKYTYPQHFMKEESLMYIESHVAIIDDRGIELELVNGGGGTGTLINEVMHSTLDFNFAPFQHPPKSITVKPYFIRISKNPLSQNKTTVTEMPSEDKPLILSQGAAGSLEVTRMKWKGDRLFVYYNKVGDNPFGNGRYLHVEDEQGHLLNKKQIRVVDPENYGFVAEFDQVSPDQKLTFVTEDIPLVDYIKDLEMTIPVTE